MGGVCIVSLTILNVYSLQKESLNVEPGLFKCGTEFEFLGHTKLLGLDLQINYHEKLLQAFVSTLLMTNQQGEKPERL